MQHAIRKLLFHWYAKFVLGNILLFWLIGLEYLPSIATLNTSMLTAYGKTLITLFIILSYLGHLAVIAILPSLLILPLILVFPGRRFIFIVSILLFTAFALWLTVDTILYKLYRFHVNGVILKLTFHGWAGNLFGLSFFETLLIFIFVTSVLVFEWLFAWKMWKKVQGRLSDISFLKSGIIFLSITLVVSYSLTICNFRHPLYPYFVNSAGFLPFYHQSLYYILGEKNIDFKKKIFILPPPVYGPLRYPLSPLQCFLPAKPMNMVIIAIDSLRFDMLNKLVMPHTFNFATEAWFFKEHFSGGNSTGPGIFSLFYGLPATYWPAMEKEARGPIFIDALLNNHYNVGIFASADLKTPSFDRSVFYAIKNLNTQSQPGSTPLLKDHHVTLKFKQFIHEQSRKKPFFSFLFYDGAHGYCTDNASIGPFQPTAKECVRFSFTNKKNIEEYFNRYKNALFTIDQEVQEIIITLQKEHLLENTVVLITGDHGEEFDDNHLGYWGHAGNFTRYQVQTPLILYLPHEKAHVFTHQTSHFDVVPTLLARVLGCQTPAYNYSVGTSLLDVAVRPYLIVSSYVDYGILEPHRILTIFPSGYISIMQADGQSAPEEAINAPLMQKVAQDMHKFYRI